MGMYDNIGLDQVKCFPIINCIMSKNDMFGTSLPEETLEIMEIGGNLTYFHRGSTVPYKSLYYNYGKNFMLFDYRFMFTRDEERYVHIIRNGIYTRSVHYTHINSRIPIYNVYNSYGEKLKITSPADFTEIVKDNEHYVKMYNELTNNYRSIDKEKLQQMTYSEVKKHFDAIEKEREAVYQKTYSIFNSKWFDLDNEDKAWPLGALLHFVLFIDICDDKISLYLDSFVKEVEKHKKDLNKLFEDYVNWFNDAEFGNTITVSDLESIFSVKNKSIVEEKLGWVREKLPALKTRIRY